MHNSAVGLCAVLSDKQRVCAREAIGNVVCVFILFISPCLFFFFMACAQALAAAERVKERERKRVFSISF